MQKVILFGSYAAGRCDLFTDLGLLVVMDSSVDFVTRNAKPARRLSASIALDLLACTSQEMDRMRDRPLLQRALRMCTIIKPAKAHWPRPEP